MANDLSERRRAGASRSRSASRSDDRRRRERHSHSRQRSRSRSRSRSSSRRRKSRSRSRSRDARHRREREDREDEVAPQSAERRRTAVADEPEPMDVDASAKAEALQFEQLEAVRNVQLITRNEYPLEHLQRQQLLSRDFDDDDGDDASGAGVCYCSYPDAADAEKTRCDDVSCLNFATYVECGANCPAREHCSNQRLQQPELFPKLEAFKTEKKGFGVRTTEAIAQSRIIGEYVGEIIDQKELTLRLKSAPRHELNFYYLLLEPGIYIDARNKGCFTRFVNHSCEPNCRTEKWTVKGETRIAVIALRDIGKLEELTFDYQWKSLGSRQITCYCESANCKGVIGTESDNVKSDEPNGVFREPEKSEVGAAIVGRRIRIFKSPDDHAQYYIATIKNFDEKDDMYEVDYQDTIEVDDAEYDEDDGHDDSPEEKKGERFVRLSEMDWQIFVELDGMSEAQIEKAVFSIPKKRVSAAKRNLDGELVDGEGNVITNKLLVKGISIKCDLAAVRRLFVVDDRRQRSSAGLQSVVADLEMFFFDDDSGWALVEFTDTKYSSMFKRKLNARPLEGKELRVFHAGKKEVENFHRAKRNFALRRLHSNNAKAASGSSDEKTAETPKTIVPYCFGRRLNWQVSVEQMEDSPSRRLGVSPSLEQKLRLKCVKLIQRLMKKLHLDREDATSAIIALNRYLTFHAMNVSKVENLAVAIFHLFLRAHARKISWVAFVSEVHAAKTASSGNETTKQLDDKSDEFKAVERQLLSVEKEILEGLRYDLSSEDPYAMLESLLSGLAARSPPDADEGGTPQQIHPPADVLKEARQLVSDALRLPIWVQTPVACIVLSILYVSAAVTHALKETPSASNKEGSSATAAAIPVYLPVLDGKRNELESLMLLECALSLCDNLKERWVRLEKIAKANRKANQSEDVFDTEQFAVVREKPVEISQRISDLLKSWINIPTAGSSARIPSPSPERDSSSRKSDEFITLSMIDKSFLSMRIAGRTSSSRSMASTDNTEHEIVAAARVVPKQVAKGPGGGSTTILSSADRLETSGVTEVEVIRKRVLLGTVADDLPFDVAGKRVFLQPWPNRDHAPAFSKDGSISKSCVRELSAAISLNSKHPSGFLKLFGIVFPDEKKQQPSASAKLPSASGEDGAGGLDVDMLEFADTAGSSMSSSLNRLDSSMHYLAFEQPLHMYAGIFEAKVRVPMQLKKKVIFDLLQSLSACHEHNFVHRFVSPTHLFLFKNGAKLGGFHAIRKVTSSKTRESSNPLYEMNEYERKELCTGSWVTVSAPEILLGDCNFSWRCDIWSAGCVALAVLLDNVALLHGADSKVQVDKIFRMCGTPSIEYKDAMKLPLYKQFRPKGEYKKRLRKTVSEYCVGKNLELPEEALVLLESMLQLNPANRKSAKELLELDFFSDVARSPSDAFNFTALPETYPIQQKRMLAQLKSGKYKRRRPTSEGASSGSGSHRSSRHHHRKSEGDSRSESRSRPSSSHRGTAETEVGDDVPLPEFSNFSADPSAKSSSSSKGLLSPVRSSHPEKRAKLGWGMGLHSDSAN